MRLRSEPIDVRERAGALFRPWTAAVGETIVMMLLVGGVCLSWPQLGRALVLATRIVISYCFSPR
jgi:hypothetical protein